MTSLLEPEAATRLGERLGVSGPNDIAVVDQTLRDAHQCLWATRMTTAHMLPVAEMMDRIGFQRIEVIAAIQFDVCVRFLKENPWERVRLMRQRITRTPLSSFLRSKNIVSFDFVPDDIVTLYSDYRAGRFVRMSTLSRASRASAFEAER